MEIGKLNPNYRPVVNFLELVEDGQGRYSEKLRRLAIDIGNSIRKVKATPPRVVMRKLKKFFIKSRWFKKVRIIRRKLFLFRKRGRFAIVLSGGDLYNLRIFAKEMREQRAY